MRKRKNVVTWQTREGESSLPPPAVEAVPGVLSQGCPYGTCLGTAVGQLFTWYLVAGGELETGT